MMLMKTDLRRAAIASAAALAALASAPAHATASASASLGPLTITLTDLDPNDGIAPSITFNDAHGYANTAVGAVAHDYSNGAESVTNDYRVGAWTPVAVATSGVANAWASASVSGNGSADGTTLVASGAAFGSSAGNSSDFGGGALAPYGFFYGFGQFTLSAHTSVTFSASAAASAGVTNVWDPAITYGYEWASADAGLEVRDAGFGVGTEDFTTAYVASKPYDTSPPCTSMTFGSCYGPDSASESRTVSVSLVNDADESSWGWLRGRAEGSGQSYALAVPEPSTYALMLAGLAATVFVARRRRA